MKQQKDYLDKDIPEEYKELLQTKGIHRDVLEIRNIKANTELSIQTLKKLKYDNLINLFFLIIGALLTFFLTNFSSTKNENLLNEKIEKLTLKNEKMGNDFEEFKIESNLKLEKLKSKFDTLK